MANNPNVEIQSCARWLSRERSMSVVGAINRCWPDMKSPRPAAEALAINLVSGTDVRVKQAPSNININKTELTRDFPIIAAHWFGLDMEAVH